MLEYIKVELLIGSGRMHDTGPRSVQERSSLFQHLTQNLVVRMRAASHSACVPSHITSPGSSFSANEIKLPYAAAIAIADSLACTVIAGAMAPSVHLMAAARRENGFVSQRCCRRGGG